MDDVLLRLRDMRVAFETPRGLLRAVRGVTLDLHGGETLALVGESGSGKSALARGILRLNQPPFTLPRTRIEGRAELRDGDRWVDLTTMPETRLAGVRARAVAMIAQESLSGLNPVWRVGRQVAEALRAADPANGRDAARAAAVAMLAAVGLPEPEAAARRYPHQLSGGQRQRVMIAMAVIRGPRVLIADEPTTALDVTVQARILRLLTGLRADRAMSMIFISHDLGVVAQVADRIAVMYAGSVVELGSVRQVLTAPRHPYTAHLIAMQPGNRTRGIRQAQTLAQVHDPLAEPAGCAFRPRCPRAADACAAMPAWQGTATAGHRCLRVAP